MKDLHCCTSSEKKKRPSHGVSVSLLGLCTLPWVFDGVDVTGRRQHHTPHKFGLAMERPVILDFYHMKGMTLSEEIHEKLRPQIVKTHLLQREHKRGNLGFSQRRNGEL